MPENGFLDRAPLNVSLLLLDLGLGEKWPSYSVTHPVDGAGMTDLKLRSDLVDGCKWRWPNKLPTLRIPLVTFQISLLFVGVLGPGNI